MRDEGSERGVIRENHPPRGEDELAFVDGWTDGRMDGWTDGRAEVVRTLAEESRSRFVGSIL